MMEFVCYRCVCKRDFAVFGNVFKQFKQWAACLPLICTFLYPYQFSCIGLPPDDDDNDGFDFSLLFCLSIIFWHAFDILFNESDKKMQIKDFDRDTCRKRYQHIQMQFSLFADASVELLSQESGSICMCL